MMNRSEYQNAVRSRQKREMWLTVVAIIVLLLLVAVAWRAMASGDEGKRVTTCANMPDAGELMKVSVPDGVPVFHKSYKAMEVNFNPHEHVPNYVAWELTGDEAEGMIPRSDDFAPDEDVPGCATLADYRGSGYQRGHMMPAADAKFDARAMSESFLLTNMCPQTGALNAGAWGKLENKCRTWALADSAIIIIAGPVLTDRITERIGESGVAVPERFFKVILAPYADHPRAIGFIMPNGKVPGGMQSAAVSVDEVERVTGFDFFAALPDSIEDRIEAECKFQLWSRHK